jgi:deoxyribodipyrimidine photo-lyase
LKQPLLVVFVWSENFLNALPRQYAFMAKGLLEVQKTLERLNIPFHVLPGEPKTVLPEYLSKLKAGLLVADAHVLREVKTWKEGVAGKIQIAFQEVDAHNIIPVWEASPKAEYGAYTIRPKISRKLADYLIEYPAMEKHPYPADQRAVENGKLKECTSVILKSHARESAQSSGSKAAWSQLRSFIQERLVNYDLRNDPNIYVTSRLSPYLHFGQISAQRVALEVNKAHSHNKAEFLEELIVRRELSDNFCYYNNRYDAMEGFPDWAQLTLKAHAGDVREYVYREEELEAGVTHDPLWNAAQREMVASGSMPGYLRMYWAKKILEWTENPEQALAIAIRLNNTYFLDGRDPNGYAGIAWSIGGVHDRPWPERTVFGKIRFMSYQGAARKFKVKQYIEGVAVRTGEAIPGYPVESR